MEGNDHGGFSRHWPATRVARQVRLKLDDSRAAEDTAGDLSAAVRVGRTLFLGSDEGVHLELLEVGDVLWGGHRCLSLASVIDVDGEAEADIEGLAEDDGWLWVLGSHARTRPKIGAGGEDVIELDRFAKLRDTKERCLLASIPLVPDPERGGAVLPVAADGDRRAGLMRQGRGGNALARAIAKSPLLRPFTRVPAKEGGIDLEGIAVAGSRVAIGLRGPVPRSFAALIEITVERKRSGRLKLAGGLSIRLLDLEGLGIRDLKRWRDDLLILAGPTTGLDGPCAVYRWPGWLHDPPRDTRSVRLHRPERIIELPFGRGNDHPEGLALVEADDGRQQLLVVCDTPAADRLDAQERTIACDLFNLPG
jgi:hypothetical protein